jgi:hypothetical protein
MTHLQSLWRNQSMEQRPMTADEVRARAREHARRKRVEAAVGVVLGACLLAGGVLAGVFYVEDAVSRVILAGALVLGAIVVRHELPQAVTEPSSEACLVFYRGTLVQRRRQVAMSFDVWGGAAGLVLLAIRPLPGVPWFFYVLLGLGLAGMFVVRYRGARQAERELAALDAMR